MVDTADTALRQRPEPFDGVRVNIPAHVHLLRVVESAGADSPCRGRGHRTNAVRRCRPSIRATRAPRRAGATSPALRSERSPRTRAPCAGRCRTRASCSLSPGAGTPTCAFLRDVRPTYVSSISTGAACIGSAILRHQLVANQVRHAPRRLVGDAKLPLKLLRRDAAPSAGHQVHRVEPQVQRRGRLVKDRPGRRVQVVAAAGAGPRLALLRRLVALEHAGCSHFGQVACSPSRRSGCARASSRQVSSSGNSRMKSMREYSDSDDAARLGLLRFTAA